MTTLRDLTERLEKATCADQELATDIVEALGFQVRRDGGLTRWGRRHPSHAYLSDGHWCASRPIMASVDAALALCERVLKTYSLHMTTDPSGNGAELVWWPNGLSDFDNQVAVSGVAESLPIAILIALLRATEPSNGGTA